MIRRTPSSTRTDTLFPYTTLVRSHFHLEDVHRAGGVMAILGELDRASLLDTSVPTVHTPSLGEALKTWRSEEHTSELQSLIRISYAVFCLKKKKTPHHTLTMKCTCI